MLNDYPDVLTVPQVAEILRIGKNAAYRLIKENIIGVLKIGRGIRVPKTSLVVYLNSAKYRGGAITAD